MYTVKFKQTKIRHWRIEKEDIMQALRITGKVVLLPILLLLKAIVIVIGLLLKLTTAIAVISTSGFAGIVQGVLSFCSSIAFILMLYNFFFEKGMEYTPFIIIIVATALGVVLIEIAEWIFSAIYSIGDCVVEKGMEIPVWF